MNFRLPVTILMSGLMADTALADMSVEDVRTLLREYPVSCVSPEGSTCQTIAYTSLVTTTRGLEISRTAFEVEAGVYVVMSTSSTFTLTDDGVCYPNVAQDVLDAALLVTNSLDATGLQNAGPLPPQGRDYMTSALLRPVADLLSGGAFCTEYAIPETRPRTDVFMLTSYLGDEPIDVPSLIRHLPEESMEGLSLRPSE